MHKLLLNRKIYDDFVVEYIPRATRYLWIVTADIKDMHMDVGRGFESALKLLSELVQRGVAVRLIHAKEPGPRFRDNFDRYPPLRDSELFERILCPRVHTKAIVIDGVLAFVGSPNLTGAGMGAKNADRRNFEAGFMFDDPKDIAELTDWIDTLYLGEHCKSCQRREFCPDPIIDGIANTG
ncbi:MAG TPA: phosphatidylserine synthase [Gammaproteobacteria bacterium]|nr:phosphatidylserine synthase [Gammaproteobacteria bacterium]